MWWAQCSTTESDAEEKKSFESAVISADILYFTICYCSSLRFWTGPFVLQSLTMNLLPWADDSILHILVSSTFQTLLGGFVCFSCHQILWMLAPLQRCKCFLVFISFRSSSRWCVGVCCILKCAAPLQKMDIVYLLYFIDSPPPNVHHC